MSTPPGLAWRDTTSDQIAALIAPRPVAAHPPARIALMNGADKRAGSGSSTAPSASTRAADPDVVAADDLGDDDAVAVDE